MIPSRWRPPSTAWPTCLCGPPAPTSLGSYFHRSDVFLEGLGHFFCEFETSWNLGSGTVCCSAGTWTNVSSSNKIQRNYKGLKITACVCSWDKLWTIRYKKTKTQLPPLKSWEQKQGTVHDPCTRHHQVVGISPKPPLRPDPWTRPYPHSI